MAAGIHLGTLNEDWSPSSAASDSENNQPFPDDSGDDEEDHQPHFYQRRAKEVQGNDDRPNLGNLLAPGVI